MSFESYDDRIMFLHEYYHKQIKPKKVAQKLFHIKKTNMEMVTIETTQFAGLNDKKFDFFMELFLFLLAIIYWKMLGRKKRSKKGHSSNYSGKEK